MLIVDAHLDIAWNALQFERDLLQSVHTIRQTETTLAGKGRGLNTVALPEMRQGRVFLSIATLLARASGHPAPGIEYRSVEQAHAVAEGQLAYYRALEAAGHIRIIENVRQLEAHVADWQVFDADAMPAMAPPLGFVISMEGADPITRPEELEHWHALGLRLLGPAHYGPNRYAGGTGVELGLTDDLGARLLREMQRLNIALDCTHLCDQSFWEAVKVFDGALLASHQNCRALVPMQRQFSDEQLRVIIERDGVIGASFDIIMVRPGWQPASMHNLTAPNPVLLAEVVEHIDHVCQLAGDAQHAAIGSDLDGGFGREQSPRDLDTIADLQKIAGLLAGRGYAGEDIAAILHGNWLRFLRRVLA